MLAVDRGWGQQRIVARAGNRRTQAAGNDSGLPLSVAGMRPSKTGTYFHNGRCVADAQQDMCEQTPKRIDADSRNKEIGDLGDKAESETTQQQCGLRRATGFHSAPTGEACLATVGANPTTAHHNAAPQVESSQGLQVAGREVAGAGGLEPRQ